MSRQPSARGYVLFAAAAGVVLKMFVGTPAALATCQTYGSSCMGCHGGWDADYTSLVSGIDWGKSLHDRHRFDMLSGDCSTCHTGSPGSNPVCLDSSSGGVGLPPLSCVGCHGRDQDAGHDDGDSPGRGAGLRQHHYIKGITTCADCHVDANPANYRPVGENVQPPYYADPLSAHAAMPKSACSLSEDFDGDGKGLDNDGDGLYELGDSECRRTAAPAMSSFSLIALCLVLFALGCMQVARSVSARRAER